MNESYKKLIKTLQTIFEMDKADLDFGIYRIMNLKRADINAFLENDLLPQVKEAFAEYAPDGNSGAQAELSKLIKTLTDAGVDPDESPKVQEFKEQLKGVTDSTALENDVFSKLHTFFSRYYDKGDFISKRRYKADTYAIPYEGEEVKLYWANHDQYYIKSSEHLRDYAFLAKQDGTSGGEKTVRIKLVEADTEKDNVKAQKDEERKFILDEECPLSEEDGELLIHFNYVPAGKQKQEKFNEAAVETIFAQEGFDEWLDVLKATAPTEAKPKRTLLERHLNEYTARNTFDYFIHKDLGNFLERELDFFIKNEVMFLDDIEYASFAVTEQQLKKVKIIRSIAKKVIRMLAHLEDYQKKLWLKKKFITSTNYLISISKIPFNFYEEISKNSAQKKEWSNYFGITEKIDAVFIKNNPRLVLDTAFFTDNFKDEIIAGIENIDETCNGVLIKGDNFNSLRLLENAYRGKVSCIHIDPPYNTDTSGFLYKNSYRTSSWLSFIRDRVYASISFLDFNGSIQCHIDENEYENLFKIFSTTDLFNMGTIIWDKRNPMNGGSGIANQHEYLIFFSKVKQRINQRNKTILSMLDKAKEFIDLHGGINELSRADYSKWVNGNDSLSGGEKAYRYIDDDGRIFRAVSLRAPEPREDPKFHQPLIHPQTGKPCSVPPNGFSRTPETLKSMIENGLILFGQDESTQPNQKAILTVHSLKQLTSMIQEAKKGKSWTDNLGLSFPYCHPVSLYEELIGATVATENSYILDFFAGSGTTAEAVLNLNAEDQINRKLLLMEMGDHFEEVLLPRLKKLSYSLDWKNGVPNANGKSVPFLFKYHNLESYEDIQNNLVLTSNAIQQQTLEQDSLKEDYVLGYWLDVETAESPSLLNIDQFEDPFNYKLNIGSGSVGATKSTIVDVVETFNYLIGLTVKAIDVIKGFKVVTGTNPQGDSVLVVWRTVKENDNETLEAFLDKQGYNPRDTEFDHIYVNGDHTLEDPQHKVKMTEIEFKRLMFDVSDV